MKRLDELFEVHNGLASQEVVRSPRQLNKNWVSYIRPSFRQDTSIDAYVNKCLVPSDCLYPKGTLYVSTDGQGSHTYAYVSVSEFVPNSNVSVLIPHDEMSLGEKLYYAFCITKNRFKFSYGRKPKGDKLKRIMLPDKTEIPSFARGVFEELVNKDLFNSTDFSTLSKKATDTSCFSILVPLNELFNVENGIATSNLLLSKKKRSDNWIALIRPSYRQNTSIDAFVNKCLVPQEKIFPKGTLYVSTNGQGSHTYSYVSASEFIPNSDVSVLKPKRDMTLREKLFYAMCITRNRFKFSYGRKPKGEKLEAIMLPKSIAESFNDLDLEKFLAHLS
ncbi:MAG: hypothetical protein J6W75_10335 [Bacteroidaceae bacterium]|nr:hypothetical protein [Bacteroidaceae bacterium]